MPQQPPSHFSLVLYSSSRIVPDSLLSSLPVIQLYYDLTLHLKRASASQNFELCDRVRTMMNEIKGYATLLEEDLSLLNMFYNGKKAWPENILKIRQTIYKKRHAQVLVGSDRHCHPVIHAV